MIASTRCRVLSATPDWPLSTLETVGADTPASRAMSATVTSPRRRPGTCALMPPAVIAVVYASELRMPGSDAALWACGRRPRRARRAAGGRRSGAGGAVDAEAGWCGVVACPGALEAERGVATGADGGVVAEVGAGDAGSALGDGGVPGVGDLLVAGEGEGQSPAVDRGGAGVVDGHIGDEPAGPLARLGIRDMTRAAGGSAAYCPGECGRAGRAGGVRRGGCDVEGACGGRGARDQPGRRADRQPGGEPGRAVGQGLARGRVAGADLQAGRGADGAGARTRVGHRDRVAHRAAEGGLHGGVGGLGLVVLVVHGGGAEAGEGAGDPGVGVADAPLGHADAAGPGQAVADDGGE